MRTSRRRQNLAPEFSPEPTPPPSEDERSFEIETEEEEQARIDREDALEAIRLNKSNKSKKKKQDINITNDDINLEEMEDINFNKNEDEQLIFEDEKDSDSDSSIEYVEDNKENISLDIAKMTLAMGNTKIVEKFLKSLESEKVKAKGASKDNIDTVYKSSGKVLTSGLRGFSTYWNDHLTKLDLNFKLTIFNDRWIELDHMVEGSNTTKKKDKPTGLVPKSEWWMSYADWTRAKSLMLKYLRQTYFHIKFANDLEKHFDYVEDLALRHGWLTAFRYDILVRTDVMCNRVDGAPGDPKIQRSSFLEEAKARTDLLRDGRIILLDNPYAKGNIRERFNPITGRQYPEGTNHDCVENVVDENEGNYRSNNSYSNTSYHGNNFLKPPQFQRGESFPQVQRRDSFRKNENYQQNFQNNRRNNRGRNFNREKSPTPYQRNDTREKTATANKGKQVDRSQIYRDEEPRQSTSKEKQS